ncbi:UDP-N-acetylmuramate--L-alanine ligase [Penaeicola halotolerans]|uniref:UDP-N-acetylmuramate--L-alanine ligase n=1 Tax=Penaeicola halotolerans TaxID=2793196 RepID=UPI001CF86F63|nr:Mur ligase family protein [Penaeicola halotolerans]
MQSIHFIAIGGSIMHNLALALQQSGYQITGSDDEIHEPSYSRLSSAGLLPKSLGWYPDKITKDIDAVIVGMHARKDNPELLKAQELGLAIYSFPEFIYQKSLQKQRVVIAGSHGKTTITSMILHVLKYWNKSFDYAVGAQIASFDLMVKLSDAPLIIIEGDEYLSSPTDPRPKFLHYHHHIALISGIAWDHFNVFPQYEQYIKAFEQLIDITDKGGIVYYYAGDKSLAKLFKKDTNEDFTFTPYEALDAKVKDGKTYLKTKNGEVAISVFGDHNLQNLSGAMSVLLRLGITTDMFYEAIASFKGASKRLEKLFELNETVFFKDFAHAPSKLKATVEAVKTQYPKRKLVAVQELHTYSSLNKEFIQQYKDTAKAADEFLIYINPKAVALKKLEMLSLQELQSAFNRKDIQLFTDKSDLENYLCQKTWKGQNLLLMGSGSYDHMDLTKIQSQIQKTA